jgi:hypothetical protein
MSADMNLYAGGRNDSAYLAGTMLESLQNGTEAAVVRLLRRQLETQASQERHHIRQRLCRSPTVSASPP